MNEPTQLEIYFPNIPMAVQCQTAIYTLEKFWLWALITAEQDRVLRLADQIIQWRLASGTALTSPQQTREYLRLHLQARKEEVMAILFLDSKHRVIKLEELFRWTIDSALVYTRVLVRRALEHNASACIMVHNHPSWDPTPSEADKQITRRVHSALDLIDVKLLDHFVVGREGTRSLAELWVI